MKKEDLIITLNLADTRISEFINSESIISYEPIKVVILDTHVFWKGIFRQQFMLFFQVYSTMYQIVIRLLIQTTMKRFFKKCDEL